MKGFGLLWLLVLLMLPAVCFAQDEGDVVQDFEAYVAQLNAKCPIEFSDGWGVNSCVTAGDSAILEIQTPGVLAGFLPMLTGTSDNVKKLWIKQLSEYDEYWNPFVELLVAANRSLDLVLVPKDSDVREVIKFSPADFAR